MAPRTRKSKSVRKVDFSEEVKYFEEDKDVELVVKSAEWEEGTEHPYIAIEFNGVGEYEEASLYHNASISPKALGRTRALLESLGLDIPDGDKEIDVAELVGLHVMGHTYLDAYKGNDGKIKESVKCDTYWPVDDAADEPEEKPKRGAAKKKEPEKYSQAQIEGMDRDELIEVVDSNKLEVDYDTRKLKKDDEALAAAVLEALEAEDLLEEEKKKTRGKKEPEEEEEEPKGKASSKAGSKKSSKKLTWTEEAIQDMSEDELEEVIEKAGVEVDLSEFPTLRKKKNAVVDALDENDQLEKE